MAREQRPTEETGDAQVIALQCNQHRWPADGALPPDGLPCGAGGRTIRPIDVLLLLPLIVPLVATILLGLLGWFVAWLAIVASLVTAIVCGDLARMLWPRGEPAIRTLDRHPIG